MLHQAGVGTDIHKADGQLHTSPTSEANPTTESPTASLFHGEESNTLLPRFILRYIKESPETVPAQEPSPRINENGEDFRLSSPTQINGFSPYASTDGGRGDFNVDDGSTSSQIKSLLRGSIFTNGLREPLSHSEDARLFQHYIDNLASWVSFDGGILSFHLLFVA